jgi:Dolichyl-phosphate-mannose-protein mannosyltransferase
MPGSIRWTRKEGLSLYHRSLTWLSLRAVPSDAQPRRARLITICAIIFVAAFCVRLIHWGDYRLNIGADQSSLVNRYKQQAQRMLDREGVLYPRDYEQHRSVQLIVHPPGYSIFIAGIYGLFGKSDDRLVLAQIICDSVAAVLVFLLAGGVVSNTAAMIAGLLVAFSPHLAHHSLLLLPESLAVLPILIAVWLVIRARKHPRLATVLTAGAMLGLTCWLRSNTLMLAPFLALVLSPLFARGQRLKHAMALVCATIVVISPITIRNWVVFGHFIPLSLGSGITMIEGIADYDKENRFGMPATDDEAGQKDVEWHNRPDYAVGLWRPDGIERDRYRFARGLDVVRSNPVWFAGVMIRRAASMLRYNDSLAQGWPADTAKTAIVSAEPSFGHQLAVVDEPVWSSEPAEVFAKGSVLSPQTECALSEDRQTLSVAGNNSDFDDQFASPIAVKENTDYVLKVPVKLVQGKMALKLTSADRRISLASYVVPAPEEQRGSASESGDASDQDGDTDNESAKKSVSSAALDDKQRMPYTLMPFATGSRSDVRFVVSNNGRSSARSQVVLGRAELFEQGPTPHRWSRFVRPAVRGIQRNLYTTSHMLPLIGIGVILLGAARRWRVLLVLLAVPAYYLLVQSALHTEYRYILPIHYFLFVMAAVPLSCLGAAIAQASRLAATRLAPPARKA